MKRLAYLLAPTAALVLAYGCGSSAPTHRPAGGEPKDHFLPGGILALAEGRVPHGPPFAVSALRYRFEGKLHSDLQAQMEPRAKLTGTSGSFSPSSREPFEWTTEEGCDSRVTWSVLYGLLRAGDRGVVFVGPRRYPLRTAPIPARFRLPGQLGYAALLHSPTRVLVHDDVGRVVQDDELGHGHRGHCSPGESSSMMVLRKKG